MAGATSFDDLSIVGVITLLTFHEAVERKGLVKVNNTLDESLVEVIKWMMPYVLRRFFATILVFCEPSNVFRLWRNKRR